MMNIVKKPSVSHENDKPAVKKNSILRTVFENLRFWCPKKLFTCRGKAKTEQKIFVFKNSRIRVQGALGLGTVPETHKGLSTPYGFLTVLNSYSLKGITIREGYRCKFL